MAKVPIFGPLSGAKTDEEKRLLAKQKQMAEEAKKRQAEVQRMRMNALGQQMLAFNPQNQMMAQMFGPEAAFSPQQMAQMANDPGAMTPDAFSRAHEQSLRTGQPMQGMDADAMRRMQENEQRKKMVASQMTPLGPGPAPLKLPPPAAARRF
jgi:hypothetical protein